MPLLQLGAEPALQEDDLAHDVLVQRVLQLLTLKLLEIDLMRIFTNDYFASLILKRFKYTKKHTTVLTLWDANNQKSVLVIFSPQNEFSVVSMTLVLPI